MLELNQVHHGDCLDLMHQIDDKSIDLIIIDPPYNIGKDKWDKIDNYLDFMQSVFLECERILKDNGSFYWFHNDFEVICELRQILKQTEFVFKQLITWCKINESFKNLGFVQQRLSIDMMRNYYGGFTEYILFYTFQDETGLTTIKFDTNNFSSLRQYFLDEYNKANLTIKKANQIMGLNTKGGNSAAKMFGNNKDFELPTEQRYKRLQSTGYFQKPYESLRQEYESLRQEYESLRYTFNNGTVKNDLMCNANVWFYPPSKKQGHLTPKPIELIENIILHSSNEGDLILDCFAGSGTTALAARNLNRDFSLIEKELEYVELIKKRLDEPVQTRLT
jgi:site-specific DNA-methyltransferase (adenine-specific)